MPIFSLRNFRKSALLGLVALAALVIYFFHTLSPVQLLAACHGTGIDALDEAIRASGGTGFQEAFRRWGSLLALPDANALPAGYGHPSIQVGRFKVPALNGPDFARFLRVPPTLPRTLEPYSHIPITYADQSGHYIKKIDIPPGVVLTVYIH